MSEEMKVLGTKRGEYSGDYVLENLEMGTDKGFSKVADYWLENGCMTFDKGRELLDEQQSHIEDFRTSLSQWECVSDDDGVKFRNKETDQKYKPTEHAITNICAIGRGMSTWAVRSMMDAIPHPTKKDDDGESVVIDGGQRTKEDYDVLRDYINVHLFNSERVDQNKTRLIRTWDDGTMRALLSKDYIIVNNGWYLDILEEIIPGGLLSHWRGDADTIYGNVLIPDTIRQEDDSDFGGMLSIGNSEIGTRRISSRPSVFRAICMNGCIWNQEKGKGINKIHRGKNIDFQQLKLEIKQNLEAQIPLLPDGIQRVLGIKAYGCGDTPMVNCIAQVGIDFSLQKKQIEAVYDGYLQEINTIGHKEAKTAYGLMNAITRAGQTFSNKDWLKCDEIGGQIAYMTENHWEKFRNRAGNLSDKQLKSRVGDLVSI